MLDFQGWMALQPALNSTRPSSMEASRYGSTDGLTQSTYSTTAITLELAIEEWKKSSYTIQGIVQPSTITYHRILECQCQQTADERAVFEQEVTIIMTTGRTLSLIRLFLLLLLLLLLLCGGGRVGIHLSTGFKLQLWSKIGGFRELPGSTKEASAFHIKEGTSHPETQGFRSVSKVSVRQDWGYGDSLNGSHRDAVRYGRPTSDAGAC